MRALPKTLRWMIVAAPMLAGGCASYDQPSNVVLIRAPGHREYSPPAPVAESAKALWEYAVLSENAYWGEWKRQRDLREPQEAIVITLPEASQEAYAAACVPGRHEPLPLPGWTMWGNFPSPAVIREALAVGLYVEVWEKSATPPVIAVVFRGTEFTSLKDWVSNLRWFLWFVPGHEDQYTLVSKRVGQELVDRLAERRLAGGRDAVAAVSVVATGHSLGGGLAQHLAYSLPPKASDGAPVPRVSNVYAFDPSPVTGWYSVDSERREPNADALWIDRVFEHGEILAYLRLALSYVNPPSAAHPSIQEIRYNFVPSANPFKSHSMRLLACALIDASGKARLPDLLERFRGQE